MADTYLKNGYTINLPGRKPPWGPTENALHEAILDRLPDLGGYVVGQDRHSHSILVDPDVDTAASTVLLHASATGIQIDLGGVTGSPTQALNLRNVAGNAYMQMWSNSATGEAGLIVGDNHTDEIASMKYHHLYNWWDIGSDTNMMNVRIGSTGGGTYWGLCVRGTGADEGSPRIETHNSMAFGDQDIGRVSFRAHTNFGPNTNFEFCRINARSHDGTNGHGQLSFYCAQPALNPIVTMYHDYCMIWENLRLDDVKSGATQIAAGAVADEVWRTVGHISLPDNVLMYGVF